MLSIFTRRPAAPSRDDWAERLGPMMAVTGARYDGPAGLPGPALAEEMRQAMRRCAACRDVERCTAWLAAGAPDDAWRDFCPNAALFERLGR